MTVAKTLSASVLSEVEKSSHRAQTSSMCGRYTIRTFEPAVYEAILRFERHEEPLFIPRYNVAPSQDVPVIRLDKDGRRVADFVRWGLIPSWTKGKPKAQPINARDDTVQTSGMFRQAFQRRRCLVAADGFFEWKKIGKAKQPMFIHLKDDRPFAFAGIWERWRPDEQAEPIDTVCHITTTPNDTVRPIHDRMPVILRKQDYALWLDKDADAGELMNLLKPLPDGELEAYPVSAQVNSPANDSPANVKAVDE
jgi:putative SOS response-associated peptidase YedK